MTELQNPSHVPTQSEDSQALKDLKNSVQEISGVQDRQNDIDNLEPETHKRKRRRLHKKKVRRHSPQYYEEKRLRKLQKKREQNWDSHFINEAIPDILQRKRPKTRLDHKKQFERYKISKQQLLHPALSLKKGMKLPQIQKKNQTTKSFKIRVVNKKVQSNIDERLDVYEKKDIKSKFATPNQNPKERHSVKKTTQTLKKLQPAKQSNTVNIQKASEVKAPEQNIKKQIKQAKQVKKPTKKLQETKQIPKIQEEKSKTQEKQANFIVNQNSVQKQQPKKEEKQKTQEKIEPKLPVKQQKKQEAHLQQNNNRKTQQKSQKIKQNSLKVIEKQQTKREALTIKSSKAVEPAVVKQERTKRQKEPSKKEQIKKQLKTQKKLQKTPKQVITATQKELNKAQHANNVPKIQKRQTKLQALAKLYRQKIQTVSKALNFQQQFPPVHKQVLQAFFPFLQNKKVKSAIDQQLEAIKNRKSLVSIIKKSIQNRQRQTTKIRQALEANVQPQKLPFLIIDDYRTATLVCIQDILKWKEHWQSTYKDLTKKSKTFDYLIKGQKYLLKIIQSVDFVFKDEVHKKDPFLINLYSLSEQQRQITLKIRACELLLLQEQFNSMGQAS